MRERTVREETVETLQTVGPERGKESLSEGEFYTLLGTLDQTSLGQPRATRSGYRHRSENPAQRGATEYPTTFYKDSIIRDEVRRSEILTIF